MCRSLLETTPGGHSHIWTIRDMPPDRVWVFNRKIRNKVYFQPRNCHWQKSIIIPAAVLCFWYQKWFWFCYSAVRNKYHQVCPKRGPGWGFIPMTGLPQNVVHIFQPKFFFTLKARIIFLKKRTFPFSDFHGDRTPLNPEKMDISIGAVEQWNPPSWKERNGKKKKI